MSSQDIELQYQQNPSGTINFATRSFGYELNFSGELETWTSISGPSQKQICIPGYVELFPTYIIAEMDRYVYWIYLIFSFCSHDSEEPVHKHHEIGATTWQVTDTIRNPHIYTSLPASGCLIMEWFSAVFQKLPWWLSDDWVMLCY